MGSGVSFDFLTRSMFISWLGPAVCMVLKFRRQRLISARAAHQNAWKESVLAVAAIKQSHVSICVNGAQRLSFYHCPNRTRALVLTSVPVHLQLLLFLTTPNTISPPKHRLVVLTLPI